MRETIFRCLSGLIVALYVLAKIIRPPAIADLPGEAGLAFLVALFAAYAAKDKRCFQPATDTQPTSPQAPAD